MVVRQGRAPSIVCPCPPLDVSPSGGENALSAPKISPAPIVALAGIGDGVALGGGEEDTVSLTLVAVSDVAQLPLPLLTAKSPVAGRAPEGVNVVDEFVKTFTYPHPEPPCTSNSLELLMATTGPLIVVTPPLEVTDCGVSEEDAGGRLGDPLWPAHAASAATPRNAAKASRYFMARLYAALTRAP